MGFEDLPYTALQLLIRVASIPPAGVRRWNVVRCCRRDTIASFSVATVVALLAAGCSGGTTNQASGPSTPKVIERATRQALLRVAVQFNANYAANRDGLVYDRWDSKSKAVIDRTEYLNRHVECPTAPGSAVVESATQTADGYWQVHYSISGFQFIDYWHYENGRWLFDLARSNPSAVKRYRLSFTAYAKAVGCTLSG